MASTANFECDSTFKINSTLAQGELLLRNTSQILSVAYKVKSNKLHVFEVKPVKGLLKPKSQKALRIKIVAPVAEYEDVEKNDRLQIQILNCSDSNITKEQLQLLWANVKSNKADLSLGHKVKIVNADLGFNANKAEVQRYTDQKYQSVINAEGSLMKSKNGFKSKVFKLDDSSLSAEFDKLRIKQQRLKHERDQLFVRPDKKTNNHSLMLILFICAFLLGNYIRAKTAVVGFF